MQTQTDNRWLSQFLYAMVAEPQDTVEIKATKIQTLMMMLVSSLSGLFFAAVYLFFRETLFSIILAAIALTTVILILLLRMKLVHLEGALFIHRAVNLVGNFLGTLALGGIANSTGAFLYIVASPFSTILRPRRVFLSWFGASAVLVMLEALLQPVLRQTNNIPPNASAILWGVNFLFLFGLIMANLITFLRQRDEALQALHAEQIRSESLLLNVLPEKIAARLKHEQGTLAQAHPAATVLFADIVGFTTLSTRLDPSEMINLLNRIYTQFDALSGKYQVEKIRTNGDNYMAAAGVPEANAHHARNIASMALEMIAIAEAVSSQNGHEIKFRIGINTGSLTSGIVGTRRFHYDIWGDTVNTASRMESHGEPGKIQVTEATYEQLKDEFILEPRGTIEVKGKGQMNTWFLVGRKS